MQHATRNWLLRAVVVAAVVGAGYYLWQTLEGDELPPGFASSNGRIEAVSIDIASKIAGRIETISVDEGDTVEKDEILAKMDTSTLEAQRREAAAELKRAEIAIETANQLVTQRRSEKTAAEALVAQRQSEQNAAQKRLSRTSRLTERGTTSQQALDDDQATFDGARAALSAAQAQVAAADAAISQARSQVVSAQAAVEATKARIERIEADISDSTLRAPRAGRVQYRVAQPGEVIAAGAPVLNMVDLTDVYMNFFLPTSAASVLPLGSEAHLIFDAAPEYVVPATISYVADVAQFTPRTVETDEERLKLVFRVKAQIAPELLEKYVSLVKTGVPGVAYVRTDPGQPWPEALQVKLPE
ncbi:HlyD family secretion protein [Amorphus orientalis]|uniref:HlyD family secretion protein n=1 Tax=Amorphus orientalis TaxID=649198 RepID=A0AAE3VM03_9HYPH|nr:HlyD family efflux transporter periplasmic adaptor subunit [Amorphus orientalis]MDQ0314513.1 HlyD family secretion protein [Amorphus orientalis]